jgi:hypothetical protein
MLTLSKAPVTAEPLPWTSTPTHREGAAWMRDRILEILKANPEGLVDHEIEYILIKNWLWNGITARKVCYTLRVLETKGRVRKTGATKPCRFAAWRSYPVYVAA